MIFDRFSIDYQLILDRFSIDSRLIFDGFSIDFRFARGDTTQAVLECKEDPTSVLIIAGHVPMSPADSEQGDG